MTCPECQDTGVIESMGQRVRYGRQGSKFVKVLPGEPQLIPNACFVCDTPPTRKVMRLKP